MRGEPKERDLLTADERARRLRRIRAMLDSGCDVAQVMERFGVTLEYGRKLVTQARALGREQVAG